MEILFKGLIFAVFLITLRFLGKAFSSGKDELRVKLPEEDKKMQYLTDKFMSLKNTIDKNWEREIIDIVISPPFLKKGYWTVTKYIKSVNPIDTTGEDFEIYRKLDEELVLEMNQPKESVTEKVEDLPNWICIECNEENEGSFDSCWKCQTLKQ
tara:strand:+ start:449 stop:910 length:462 start_codon:yes stop_codon:yes gene_type:complete